MGTGEAIARGLKEAHPRGDAAHRLGGGGRVQAGGQDRLRHAQARRPRGGPRGEEAAFLAPLPVRRLWGVGPKMEEALAKLGVVTIGDLAALDPAPPRAAARDARPRPAEARPGGRRPGRRRGGGGAKSLGQEHTYDQDTADGERLRATLLELADGVAGRLRAHGLRARTVTLKYRDEAFRTTTHARTLAEPTDSGNALFRVACGALRRGPPREEGPPPRDLRLALRRGTPSSASSTSRGSLAGRHAARQVAERFGDDAITRASLLGRRERRNPSDKPPR